MFTFLNPMYLAGGLGLVSSPIIIHLINRLRVKRIRWAAMEFLLKSQKKNRRRLIIEQLILLFLRCLLVVMALLLAARLLEININIPSLNIHWNWSLGSRAKTKTVHLVLLDDTLSMTDHVIDRKGATCFEVAKNVVHDEIAVFAGRSSAQQDLVLMPLSYVATNKIDFENLPQERLFLRLGEPDTQKALRRELNALKCSQMHVPLIKGVDLAHQFLDRAAEMKADEQIVVHLLSDYRQRDWGTADSQQLGKAVARLATRTKVYLVDLAHPYRTEGKGAPQHHGNIGISEFYPESRVAATGAYVRFWVVIQNYGSSPQKVRIALFDTESGRPLHDVEPPALKANPGQTVAKFDVRFFQETEGWRQLTAKLESEQGGELPDDGLKGDNVRHVAVYVRPKVPVLLVDGDPKRGKQDGGDTRHVRVALESTAGYEVQSGGVEELEQGHLDKYASIYLLNVGTLTKDQEQNLKSYVRGGGSAAFFLGKDVDPQYYNDHLFAKDRDSNDTGLFPFQLADQYYPPKDKPPLQPDLEDDQDKILLRLENFPSEEKFPVFGALVSKKLVFKFLPIRRYWKIKDRESWRPRPGQVDELATMPNDSLVDNYAAAAGRIRDRLRGTGDEKYGPTLSEFGKEINEALKRDRKGQPKKVFELADVLDRLLHDPGTEGAQGAAGRHRRPDMRKFWDRKENEAWRNEITELYNTVRFGHPLMVASHYGRGRVVVCTTTAGKEWNDWAGGSELTSWTFPAMILELQSYLTSMGSEANLTVGATIPLVLDPNQYTSTVTRHYFEPQVEKGKPAAVDKQTDTARRDSKTNKLSYLIDNTLRPGFYRFDLFPVAKGEGKAVKEERGYVFNVDTETEGPLQRVSRDVLEASLQGAPTENYKFLAYPGYGNKYLVTQDRDFSQAPLFFLIFIMILIAEQALAVHLSFHLRDGEAALPVQAIRSQSMAA
jgi:hypothetical protein